MDIPAHQLKLVSVVDETGVRCKIIIVNSPLLIGFQSFHKHNSVAAHGPI